MFWFFVREAVLNATDESTLRWLDCIKGVARSDETKVIFKLVPEFDVESIDEAQAQKEKRLNELSEHIDCLDAFESMSQYIKSALKTELERMKSG